MPQVVPTNLTLDRERTLRFDFDAIDRISDLSLGQRGGRSPLELWQHANGMDLRAMGIMVWAATRHEDPSNEFTLDRATAAVKRALRNGVHTYKRMNEILNAAMNQSECVGLFKEELDAEAALGNAEDRPRSGPSD